MINLSIVFELPETVFPKAFGSSIRLILLLCPLHDKRTNLPFTRNQLPLSTNNYHMLPAKLTQIIAD